MKKNVNNLIFKKRIYINYLNNINAHSEIEEVVELEILRTFSCIPGKVIYKTIFRDYTLTRMDCYMLYHTFIEDELREQYLFSKHISFEINSNGFWTKSVAHFKDEKCI